MRRFTQLLRVLRVRPHLRLPRRLQQVRLLLQQVRRLLQHRQALRALQQARRVRRPQPLHKDWLEAGRQFVRPFK